MDTFIDEARIFQILEKNINPSFKAASEVIEKAKSLKGLTLEDTALLLQCEDEKLINEIFEAARSIKEAIYGNRLVLFAPLYLTNICINNCLYCAFRKENQELKRKRLSIAEIEKEVEALENQGHKRLLLVASQDPQTFDTKYIEKAIQTIYNTKHGRGAIRRVNVNIAPLSVDNFKRLKKAGIGTYQLFQETYHQQTYHKVHPEGPKSDYCFRLFALDRAQDAGINDVGIGVLFGLYDYKFEILALLSHCRHLEECFGVGPHTISVPRIRPALGAPLSQAVPHPVCDGDFKKLVAIIRLSVPYTGMILSTREPAAFRDEVFTLGISQISASSRTAPGGYSEEKEHSGESEQFHLEDTRTQLEVAKDIVRKGFFPSFCTACYRLGRTGKDFMDLAKVGNIKNFCLPNSILTFKEYILDYGDEELRNQTGPIIEREIGKIQNPSLREKTIEKIGELEGGRRDLYF